MGVANSTSNAVAIIGNTISLVIFLLPAPELYCLWKKKDIDDDNDDDKEFQLHPHLIKVMNCLLWVFYGLPIIKPNRLAIMTSNSFGVVVEVVYLATFSYCDRRNKGRWFVAFTLAGELISMAIVAVITLVEFDSRDKTKRALLVGGLCVASSVVMCSWHLATMKKVIDTQNVELMPFNLPLSNMANGCIWTAYALIKGDHAVFFGYGIEALYGLAQLVVYACYYKSENDAVKLSKIHPYPLG